MSTIERRWLVFYVAAVVVGFGALYGLTRSSILIGDAQAFLDIARRGDPAQLHYGEPSHFLQVPLARALWIGLAACGLPVSLDRIFLTLSVGGTLGAIVFVGLVAAEVLRSRAAAWLAAVLFGTSLNAWTQANGELYGLALGFVAAGLFFTLRGRLLAPAVLWALAVLSHSEFALAAPAFAVAVWMAEPDTVPARERVRRIAVLAGLAATSAVLVVLLGSWMIGKWSDAASLSAWLWRSYESRRVDIVSAEVVRAIKGLVTAYTVAGHYWRDILTGRGAFGNPAFVLAAAVGLVVLLFTAVLLVVAATRRRLVLFALAWLLPFHVLINWWFVPTVEKYHAGALPGFVLMATGGLFYLAARLPARGRNLLYGGYVAACAGLNLFGAVLPMQRLGTETAALEQELRRLTDADGGRAVFVSCDDPKAIVDAGVTFLRLRSVWTGTVPEIQERIRSWVENRRQNGEQPYLVGRWCFPEEWKTTSSKAPFDLFFLERWFTLAPTSIVDFPVTEPVPTNPFSWRRGDILRLAPGGLPHR